MKAIILGAGKGKRLLSEQFNMPKVMRTANGKPLLNYVLESIDFIPEKDVVIVVGYKKELVINNIKGDYKFAVQEEQLGTGHAVAITGELLSDYDGDVLICYGDMPLFTKQTYKGIIKEHQSSKADCTILTASVDKKLAYGRIIRENGEFAGVVEQKDCSEEQDKIREYNVGIYVFNSKKLFEYLKQLKNNNAQGEYYLTDVPKMMLDKGEKVKTFTIDREEEIYGVNTPEDLLFCENILKNRTEVE